MALSKIAVCFMTAYGRGIDAARRLLGSELAGVLVTEQYAGYRFVGTSQRQLCWAHVLRNVAAIAQSGERYCWQTVSFGFVIAMRMEY